MALRGDYRDVIPREPTPEQAEMAEAWKWIEFWANPVAKQLALIRKQASRTDTLDEKGKGLERALLDMRRFGFGLAYACERVLRLLDSSEKYPEDGRDWIPPRKLREMRERGDDYCI